MKIKRQGRGRSHYLKRSYRLPPELVQKLEQEALTEGVDKTVIVIQALKLFLGIEV